MLKIIIKYHLNKFKTGFDLRNDGRQTHFNENESQILRLSIQKGIVHVRPFREHAYTVDISYNTLQHIE